MDPATHVRQGAAQGAIILRTREGEEGMTPERLKEIISLLDNLSDLHCNDMLHDETDKAEDDIRELLVEHDALLAEHRAIVAALHALTAKYAESKFMKGLEK